MVDLKSSSSIILIFRITNSPIADIAIVWAKLDGVIKGFIVERGMKGFTTPKIEGCEF